MGVRKAVLTALAVLFLSPVLLGALGGPGVRGIEAFQFSLVGCICIGTLSAKLISRSKRLLLLLLFLVFFVLLQGVGWSAFLVLALVGKWPFAWGYVALGPLGFGAGLLSIRHLGLTGETQFMNRGGPGPLAPA
jgi:hypothetical protein